MCVGNQSWFSIHIGDVWVISRTGNSLNRLWLPTMACVRDERCHCTVRWDNDPDACRQFIEDAFRVTAGKRQFTGDSLKYFGPSAIILHRRLFLLSSTVVLWTCIKDMLLNPRNQFGNPERWIQSWFGHYFGYSCFHLAQNFLFNIFSQMIQALLNNNPWRIKCQG